MNSEIIYALAASILVSLVAFTGLAALSLGEIKLNKISLLLVSLAAGTLIGDVFIHIIPELYTEQALEVNTITFALLGGVTLFFIVEKVLNWRHSHLQLKDKHVHPIALTNLFGDALHNLIDGMVIGVSFLISPEIGLATTLAVVLHEIPQEIGDYGVLLHSGMTSKKALMFNFFSGLFSVLGTIIALVLGEQSTEFTNILLAFATGSFLYISLADLIPELKKGTNLKHSLIQMLVFLLGILIMFSLTLTENHDEDVHSDSFHIHAGFNIYIDGELADYSNYKYMSLGSCGEHSEEATFSESTHLHDKNGKVVHIHKKGVRWLDLLNNLDLDITSQDIQGYVNGQSVEDLWNIEIKDNDSVIFMVGDKSPKSLEYVTTDEISNAVGISENCNL